LSKSIGSIVYKFSSSEENKTSLETTIKLLFNGISCINIPVLYALTSIFWGNIPTKYGCVYTIVYNET